LKVVKGSAADPKRLTELCYGGRSSLDAWAIELPTGNSIPALISRFRFMKLFPDADQGGVMPRLIM
jgi:hypothetical protein